MLSERWRFAQEYELPYQIKKITTPEILDIKENSKKNVLLFKEFLEKFIQIAENSRILEIGCGPTGIIFFMNKGRRFGIDPNMEHYRSNFMEFVDYEKTHCVQGIGEQLPFKNQRYDIVLIHNVLDHTDNPQIVIKEAKRILKDNGIVYIGINTYSLLVYYVHRIYEFLWKISPWFIKERMRIPVFWSHPNILSEKDLLGIIKGCGLKAIFVKSRTPAEARRIFRDKRKGIFWFLISTFMYSGGFTTVIARK